MSPNIPDQQATLEDIEKADAVQFLGATQKLFQDWPKTQEQIIKLAYSLNEVRAGKYLRHALHDLRNALARILIQIDHKSDEVDQAIASALRVNQALINSILDPSRREKVKIDYFLIENAEIIVGSFVETETYSLKYRDPENPKRTFSIKCPKYIVASANPHSLQRILTNLVNNAFQHNKNATLEVTLVVEDKETHVEITVADTGKGLETPVEDLLKDGVTGEDKKVGHGHGLAIVAELIEKMGGKLEGGNNVAGGAYFRVSLPKDANQSL